VQLFHVVTQSSFALYSALQLFNLLALDASTYTSMELFLAVRLVMYITRYKHFPGLASSLMRMIVLSHFGDSKSSVLDLGLTY